MLLDVIQHALESEQISHKADLDDFDLVYDLINRAQYIEAKDLSLERLSEGCLDIRYAVYALFGQWYELDSFEAAACLLSESISIYQYYLEQVAEKNLSNKQFLSTIAWLHEHMHRHAVFIEGNKTAFSGDKDSIQAAFSDYIGFIESELKVDVTQLYQIQKIWHGFLVASEQEEETVSSEQNQDKDLISDIDNDNLATEPCHKIDNHHTLSASPKWATMLKHLEIYKHLTANQSWLKAAVVYKKITDELEKFNPIEYFPEVFYPYLDATASSFGPLMDKVQLSESAIWPVLTNMLESCPQSFVQSNVSVGNETMDFSGSTSEAQENNWDYNED